MLLLKFANETMIPGSSRWKARQEENREEEINAHIFHVLYFFQTSSWRELINPSLWHAPLFVLPSEPDTHEQGTRTTAVEFNRLLLATISTLSFMARLIRVSEASS